MAEAYQVLARKWRPQLFSELKGLEHIGRTLMNAIRLQRIGHAFLFTGSRGVGKTSAARIFAKALNCKKDSAQEPFSGEPCNVCENCLAITAGNSADVIEIDGASNRGIDEIRLLRESVTYLPQSSPYKIYIIDEVHMLTTEAFNALLKTLEEPPNHVKFIMATTDVHKMPMTILSRCQRFDFGRLTQAVIAATLAEIGQREELEFGSGVTELLAREAQGSMRDALSLLDQVRSFAGEKIQVEDMRQALGLIESRHCFSLLESVVNGEIGAAVSQVNDLEQTGTDLKRFSEEFLFYLRDVLFLKLSPKLKNLLGVSSDEVSRLTPLVAEIALPYWQQLFALWQQHYMQIKTSQTPRLALEMALIELGMVRDLKPVDELLGRIDNFLKAGPEVFSSGSGSENRSAQPLTSAAAASQKRVSSVEVTKSAPVISPAPIAKPLQSRPQVTGRIESRVAHSSEWSKKTPPPAGSQIQSHSQNRVSSNPEMPPEPPQPPDDYMVSEPIYDIPEPQPQEVSVPPSIAENPVAGAASENKDAAVLPKSSYSQKPAPTVTETVPEDTAVSVATVNKASVAGDFASSASNVRPRQGADNADLNSGWTAFVAQLGGRDTRLASMLQRSQPHLTAKGTLSLAVASHALLVLDNDAAKADILKLWSRFQQTDSVSKLELQALKKNDAGSAANNSGLANGTADMPSASSKRGALPGKEVIFNDPSVRFISERFGGRVTEIRKY